MRCSAARAFLVVAEGHCREKQSGGISKSPSLAREIGCPIAAVRVWRLEVKSAGSPLRSILGHQAAIALRSSSKHGGTGIRLVSCGGRWKQCSVAPSPELRLEML